MKKVGEFVAGRLMAGALVVAPVYLAILLLLKAARLLARFVRPLAKLLPKWLPAENILSILLVLIVCFLVGLMLRTALGSRAWTRAERSLFQRIPGYTLFRSLTQRLAGDTHDETWKPALAEIEEALVPAFLIEELADGRFTVFVPSAPTPFAGTIYILTPDRVHPLNIPFTRAVGIISRWGSGSKDLVAAIEDRNVPPGSPPRDDIRLAS
jgi:uncharacterized membrane protein